MGQRDVAILNLGRLFLAHPSAAQIQPQASCQVRPQPASRPLHDLCARGTRGGQSGAESDGETEQGH
jgi:hypothetical protein